MTNSCATLNSFHPRKTRILRMPSLTRHTIFLAFFQRKNAHMSLVNSVYIAGHIQFVKFGILRNRVVKNQFPVFFFGRGGEGNVRHPCVTVYLKLTIVTSR